LIILIQIALRLPSKYIDKGRRMPFRVKQIAISACETFVAPITRNALEGEGPVRLELSLGVNVG